MQTVHNSVIASVRKDYLSIEVFGKPQTFLFRWPHGAAFLGKHMPGPLQHHFIDFQGSAASAAFHTLVMILLAMFVESQYVVAVVSGYESCCDHQPSCNIGEKHIGMHDHQKHDASNHCTVGNQPAAAQ